MHPRHKGKIAIAAAGLIVLGSAGGTYAATKSSGDSERQAFLDDVAKRLKVDPKDLSTALREAFFDRLDAAVKAGKLDKEQADAIKARIRKDGGVPFLGPLGGGNGPGFHRGGPPGLHRGGVFFGGLEAAAKYLDLTRAELRDQLGSGKSLADIAKDKGKSVDGLKDAIKADFKARLDDAVKDKRVTQAQADKMLADIDDRLDDIVNGKPGKFGPGKRGPKFRSFRGGGGAPPVPNVPGADPSAAAPPVAGVI